MSSCTGVSENNSQSSQKFQVTYGDVLKGFRILNNLSRQELAKKIMCTSAYIGALESNTRKESPRFKRDLFQVLGVKEDDVTILLKQAQENQWSFAKLLYEEAKIYLYYNEK